MLHEVKLAGLTAMLVLGGCMSVPSGPSMLVLPGTGKNFDQFRADDYACRQFAHAQAGGRTPQQAASDSGVSSAVIGTAVGALAGAAFDGSRGAGVGAGAGLLFGSAAGAGAAEASAHTAQQRYDIGYQQCMYANGHRVPVYGHYSGAGPSADRHYPPPPPPPASMR